MTVDRFGLRSGYRKTDANPQDAPARTSLLSADRLKRLSSTRIARCGSAEIRQAAQSLSSIRISSPFSLRKIKKRREPLLQSKQPNASQSEPSPSGSKKLPYYRSPVDKPLPSIPQGQCHLAPSFSVVNATEDPLQRSLPPCNIEDWPTLLPQRQQINMNRSAIRPNKVSLSESVIERVRRLNLNDTDGSEIATSQRDDRNVTPVSTTRSIRIADGQQTPEKSSSTRSKSKFHALKQAPVVRQTRTSELRKRLSSNPLASDDPKKQKLNPFVSSLKESPSIKSDQGSQRSRKSMRQRSRSKHRVTSQGSPYAIDRVPQESESIGDTKVSLLDQEYKNVTGLTSSNNRTGVLVDNKTPDLNSNPPPEVHLTPTGITTTSGNNTTGMNREITDLESDIDVSPFVLASTVAKQKGTIAGDDGGDADDESENRAAFESSPQTKSQSILTDTHSELSIIEYGAGVAVPTSTKVNALETRPVTKPSPRSKSLVGTIYDEDDYEKFKVRPLSRSAPKYGPRLRVSESANEYLLGTTPVGQEVTPVVTNVHKMAESRENIPRKLSEAIEAELASAKNSRAVFDSSDEDFRSAEKDTKAIKKDSMTDAMLTGKQPHQKRYHETGHNSTDAPSVEPGVPRDTSKKIGWPFDESVVVPFKALESSPENESNGDERKKRVGGRNVILSDGDDATSNTGDTVPEKALASAESKAPRLSLDGDPVLVTPTLPLRSSSRRGYVKLGEKSVAAVKQSHQEPSTKASKHALSYDQPKSVSRRIHYAETEPRPELKSVFSPSNESGRVSAGRGVMSNIKGLFHKRHSEKKETKTADNQVAVAKPSVNPPSISKKFNQQHGPKIPRSPRVKNTTPTIYERRQSRTGERPFLKHRNVMTVATQMPLQSTEARLNVSSQSKASGKATHPFIETFPRLDNFTEVVRDSGSEPGELTTATSVVYNILNRAQDETHTSKKLALIELSKLMVQALHTARDAEKAKEQARQHASRAEMECVKTRREIAKVADMVEKMLRMEMNGDLEKDGMSQRE